METVSLHQLNRLIRHLENLLNELNQAPGLAIGQVINDSFHMQKVEELKLLRSQLTEAIQTCEAIQVRAFVHYKTAFCHWKKDVRWLTTYRRKLHLSRHLSGKP